MRKKRIKKYRQKHRTSFGYIGESFVETLLSAHGEVLRSKQWHYDLIFNNRFKVEVKSTQLGIVRTGFNVRRVNHGWTLYADRHQELLKEDNGFYALVLMIDKDILCVRFMEAAKATKHLNNSLDYTKKPRVRLGALYKAMKPKDFLQLCEKLGGATNERNPLGSDMPEV